MCVCVSTSGNLEPEKSRPVEYLLLPEFVEVFFLFFLAATCLARLAGLSQSVR